MLYPFTSKWIQTQSVDWERVEVRHKAGLGGKGGMWAEPRKRGEGKKNSRKMSKTGWGMGGASQPLTSGVKSEGVGEGSLVRSGGGLGERGCSKIATGQARLPSPSQMSREEAAGGGERK